MAVLRQLQTLFIGDHEAEPLNMRTYASICSMLRCLFLSVVLRQSQGLGARLGRVGQCGCLVRHGVKECRPTAGSATQCKPAWSDKIVCLPSCFSTLRLAIRSSHACGISFARWTKRVYEYAKCQMCCQTGRRRISSVSRCLPGGHFPLNGHSQCKTVLSIAHASTNPVLGTILSSAFDPAHGYHRTITFMNLNIHLVPAAGSCRN